MTEKSFWTTLPGILTAVAALLTAVGGLIGALAAAGVFRGNVLEGNPPIVGSVPRPGGTSPDSSDSGASVPISVARESALQGCFGGFFTGVPNDRIVSVEEGTRDFDVIGTNQPKADTVGLIFTSFNQPIGGIRFIFFPSNDLFRIESVVDSECRRIEAYENTLRGADKNSIHNFGGVFISLGRQTYELVLGGGSTIRIAFGPVAR